MSGRRIVTAPELPAPIGPYSHAVARGGVLYCTGQLPLDPATRDVVGATPAAQAQRCLENLAAACRAAGTDLSRALRIGIYMLDLGAFGSVNEVYAPFFGDEPPARTTIGVAALPMGALVEMDAVVALDGDPAP